MTKHAPSISSILRLEHLEDSSQATRTPTAPRTQNVIEALGGFDTVFREYAPLVASVGYRILGRRDEVDDLVQDVFLQVHRSRNKIKSTETFQGWLMTVTVNRARKRLKKRKMLRWIGWDSAPSFTEMQTQDLSPEDRTLLHQLYRVLDTLPTDDRIAWVMWHVLGEKQGEIARTCGCSLATIKRRITRAQQALQARGGA